MNKHFKLTTMKHSIFSNPAISSSNQPQFLPDEKSVRAVLAFAHSEHKHRNLIVIARSGWLNQNGLRTPDAVGHSNLCITITNGKISRTQYSGTLKHVINRQGYFLQILNGSTASHLLAYCPSSSQGIVSAAEFLRKLSPVELYQDNELSRVAGLPESVPLDFTTWANDSCIVSKERPKDSTVLRAMASAHEKHCHGNLIIIARNQWLRFNGQVMPKDLIIPNLCITITNGLLNRAFYSEDLAHIIKKQSYFVQVLN